MLLCAERDSVPSKENLKIAPRVPQNESGCFASKATKLYQKTPLMK